MTKNRLEVTVKKEIEKVKDILKNVNLSMPSLPEINKNNWWEGLIK